VPREEPRPPLERAGRRSGGGSSGVSRTNASTDFHGSSAAARWASAVAWESKQARSREAISGTRMFQRKRTRDTSLPFARRRSAAAFAVSAASRASSARVTAPPRHRQTPQVVPRARIEIAAIGTTTDFRFAALRTIRVKKEIGRATVGSPSRYRCRSRARSPMVAYRREGSFSSALRQIASRSGWTVFLHREGGTGSLSTIAQSSSWIPCPEKGISPVISS